MTSAFRHCKQAHGTRVVADETRERPLLPNRKSRINEVTSAKQADVLQTPIQAVATKLSLACYEPALRVRALHLRVEL